MNATSQEFLQIWQIRFGWSKVHGGPALAGKGIQPQCAHSSRNKFEVRNYEFCFNQGILFKAFCIFRKSVFAKTAVFWKLCNWFSGMIPEKIFDMLFVYISSSHKQVPCRALGWTCTCMIITYRTGTPCACSWADRDNTLFQVEYGSTMIQVKNDDDCDKRSDSRDNKQ